MTRAAIVIPVYNRLTVLERTLAALETQDHEELVVVVADDGSEEDVAGLVERWNPPYPKHYLRQEHRGFGAARARNLGARSVDAEVLIFLDSDGIAAPDFVSRHVRRHEESPRAVVIGRRNHLTGANLDPTALARGEVDLSRLPQHSRTDFRTILSRRTARLRRTDEGYRAFVSANVSMPMELFRETGGFDERFRWWGSEDTEFGWRLWQAGADFIDDTDCVIYHQLDADTSGGDEGRQQARELNRGLLASLVPHRFYRKGVPEPLPEVPKFSVLVHDVPEGAPQELWTALNAQTEPDFEVLFLSEGADHDPFAGAASGERRIKFEPDPEMAIETSQGEFIVFLGGHAAPRNSLLQNVRVRLERRPAASALTFGISTPGGPYGRPEDLAHLTSEWAYELPTHLAVRRRSLIRALRSGQSVSEALETLADGALHTRQALAALPATIRVERPDSFGFATTHIAPRARSTESEPSPEPATRPGVRYVGWVGKDNLGDEAMLQATVDLMPWADVSTRGEAGHLLLLGGGTLINRNQYLSWLTERDSPRLERAVFGTGVASLTYWGETEDPEKWKRWLDTCCYVGVRGPNSAKTLSDWGYEGEFEICGDPALALIGKGEAEAGSVLVAPVWTGGELWGGSDLEVVEEIAGAVSRLLTEGRKVTLFSCHPTDDRPILMIRDMVGPGTEYFCGYESVDKSMNVISSASVVIGERLHACVLAAAAGRPFVGLEYRPKVRDFAASVGMEQYVMRTDEVGRDDLVELVHAAESADLSDMNEKVREYRRLLARASDLIRSAVQQ